jgi:hypothetical protein
VHVHQAVVFQVRPPNYAAVAVNDIGPYMAITQFVASRVSCWNESVATFEKRCRMQPEHHVELGQHLAEVTADLQQTVIVDDGSTEPEFALV